MNKFYAFKQMNDETTQLTIDGSIIEWNWDELGEVSAHDFRNQMKQIETPNLEVRINSYGGEVKEGLAIYNMIKEFKGKVTTIVDGFACSIASIVFMAGTERIMNKGSLLMIHMPWTTTVGNSNELRKTAEDMDKIAESLIDIYLENATISKEEIVNLLLAETWLSADESVDFGLATQKRDIGAKNSVEQDVIFSTVQKLKQLEQENADLRSLNPKVVEPKSSTKWDGFF